MKHSYVLFADEDFASPKEVWLLLRLMSSSCDGVGGCNYAVLSERERFEENTGKREKRWEWKFRRHEMICQVSQTCLISHTLGQESIITLQTRSTSEEACLATSNIIRTWMCPLTYSWVEAGVRGHGCLYNPWVTMRLSKLAFPPLLHRHSHQAYTPCSISPVGPPLAHQLRPSMISHIEYTNSLWCYVMCTEWR